MAKVKGFFYSLSSFVLASIVFVLAFIIALNVNQSDERLRESLTLDTVNDLGNSIENVIAKITDKYFPLNIIIEENKVTILDSLGNDFAIYNTQMNNFKTFVESTESRINLSYSNFGDDTFTLLILPHNVTYFHKMTTSGTGGRRIEINDGFFIENYTITIIEECGVCTPPVRNIRWDTLTAGDVNFKVQIKNNTGGILAEKDEDINLSGLNEIVVRNIPGGNIDIEIENYDMTFNYKGGHIDTVQLESELIFEDLGDISVVYADSSLLINYSKLDTTLFKDLKLL